MKIACLAAFASLRGALLFTLLASTAGAQDPLWIRQGDLFVRSDDCQALAPDDVGGVYVSGRYRTPGPAWPGGLRAFLAHYDAMGDRTWVDTIGGQASSYSRALATDGAGGVYVTGSTYGSLGGPNAGSADVFLARYDSAGTRLWVRQLGSSHVDEAYAAAPDGGGGVYIAGWTRGNLGGPIASADPSDCWVAHYDGAGNRTWLQQFGTSSQDDLLGAAPDGSGGVFVCGYTKGSLGGPFVGGVYDAWLGHYDGAGNQSWIRQIGTSWPDLAFGTASDGTGGVYLGGNSSGGSNDPGRWMARYDGTGNELWRRRGASSGALAPDGGGGVYLGGSDANEDVTVTHLDGDGNLTWSGSFGSPSRDATFAATSDGAGGVFLGGFTEGALGGPVLGDNDFWVARYDGLRATRYCSPTAPNSTGQLGVLTATGSRAVASNDVTLIANQLPQQVTGFFLASRTQEFIANPGGSQGDLCLGGEIGRFVRPGQIQNSGSSGTFQLVLDLTRTPQPTGFVSVMPSETWNFQAWHRDSSVGIPLSNFTDAVSVTFQ